VEAPVFQVLLVALLELNVTLPPAQNVLGPFAVMLGVGGKGFTVRLTVAVGELHPFAPCTDNEYVPDVETIMTCVLSPVLQVFPLALVEVSVADCPVQIELPVLVILGVTGFGKTVTLKFEELVEHTPLPAVTE
jgi:hypothetical protein